MFSASARGEEPGGETQLHLAVVAVVAPDVLVWIRPAGHAAFQVEEPHQAPVMYVDSIGAALAAFAVVDVHAEEDPAVGDQRRRFDLVALGGEPAQPGGREAAGAGRKVPTLRPCAGI